jgi:hypothetical protein
MDESFLHNTELFVELAHQWAKGGPAPDSELEQCLQKLSRPVITEPSKAREALWGVLSYPERGRSLMWLDKMELLGELIPCWKGHAARRRLRLQAVEEVHLERWAVGLSKDAIDRICELQDHRVDDRVNGWALTGLAALLLTGDQPARVFCKEVEQDLAVLGATESERDCIVSAIMDYPPLQRHLIEGRESEHKFSAVTLIATLSTLFADPLVSQDQRVDAVKRADQLIKKLWL